MSCGIGRRCDSDPMLLRLLCRPAATAPIQPLAWELRYTSCAALPQKKEEEEEEGIYFQGEKLGGRMTGMACTPFVTCEFGSFCMLFCLN